MGLFDILESILTSAAQSTARQRAEVSRKFEREHPNLTDTQREKLNEYNRMTDKLASRGGISVRTSNSSTNNNGDIGGKSLHEWDSSWISIGMLKTADLSPYNHCVGLYRHEINGQIKYVGRAIELYNGGFRKRLSDYRRDSDSARKHTSGKIIHEHLDEIETYILIVGDTPEAVDATRKLEGIFIHKYSPEWNKMINI